MNIKQLSNSVIKIRIGIILALVGAILLAYSVGTIVPDGHIWGSTTASGETVIPTYTFVRPWFFYGGLTCVTFGSLLQW